MTCPHRFPCPFCLFLVTLYNQSTNQSNSEIHSVVYLCSWLPRKTRASCQTKIDTIAAVVTKKSKVENSQLFLGHKSGI